MRDAWMTWRWMWSLHRICLLRISAFLMELAQVEHDYPESKVEGHATYDQIQKHQLFSVSHTHVAIISIETGPFTPDKLLIHCQSTLHQRPRSTSRGSFLARSNIRNIARQFRCQALLMSVWQSLLQNISMIYWERQGCIWKGLHFVPLVIRKLRSTVWHTT